jgi:hypothetical protein
MSVRKYEDVAGLLRIRWAELDQAYIQQWIRELDLQEEWKAAQVLAGT